MSPTGTLLRQALMKKDDYIRHTLVVIFMRGTTFASHETNSEVFSLRLRNASDRVSTKVSRQDRQADLLYDHRTHSSSMSARGLSSCASYVSILLIVYMEDLLPSHWQG